MEKQSDVGDHAWDEMTVDELVVYPLIEELHVTADAEPLALRKALLGLIFLVHEESSPGVSALINYLLVLFPPVANHFNAEGLQPLMQSHDILLARDATGTLALHLHRDFTRRLHREAWERRLLPMVNEEYTEDWKKRVKEILDEVLEDNASQQSPPRIT